MSGDLKMYDVEKAPEINFRRLLPFVSILLGMDIGKIFFRALRLNFCYKKEKFEKCNNLFL